ncbi:MAG: hypothetical protein AAF417_23360 [Pseudomonadota bacterium]
MLTTFYLGQSRPLGEFCEALDEFVSDMKQRGLLERVGPVQRRYRHEIMDTDRARDHDYCVVLSFSDREQCDAAVAAMQAVSEPSALKHSAAYGLVRDAEFSCWEDVQ